MKKIGIYLTLLFALTLAISAAFAQGGLPGSGWWSGEQVQNVGDDDATITVTAYDKDTTDTFSASETVASGGAFTFLPNSFADMPSGFQGSAVVSSNQPIKAIVNVTNRLSGDLGITGGKAAAQYQGVDGSMVADTLYFPLVKGNHYLKTTTFYVQNAGSADATNVVATFNMANGDSFTYNVPAIAPNKMVAFSVFDATGYDGTCTPEGTCRKGGLIVTSDQPLAGTVMEHYTTESPATIAQSTRAFTAGDFFDTAYAPIIKNTRYNRFTGIQVQNVSGGNVDITVTYNGSAGACKGNTYQDSTTALADGESFTFIQLPGMTDLPADCTAAATIEATGNIVAVVNESYVADYVNAGNDQAAVTSSAIPANAATAKISVPLFKDDRYDKRTGLQIQNVGTVQATNIVATFSCTGGATFTAVSKPQTVDSLSAILFYTPSDDPTWFEAASPFVQNDVNCSVTVTSDQPVVAIANESVIPGGSFLQDNNNYEGFNLEP